MNKSEKELVRMYAFYKEFNELVDSSLNICFNLNSMLGGAGDALVTTFLNGLTKQLPRDIRLLRKYRKHFSVPSKEESDENKDCPQAQSFGLSVVPSEAVATTPEEPPEPRENAEE